MNTAMRQQLNTALPILLITLIGLILRLFFLPVRPPTYDEAYTLALIGADVRTMIGASFSDFTPPLYFVILKLWSILGQELNALRAFSLLVGSLTIPLAGVISGRLFHRKIGILVSLLVAFSPALIYESTNARMYSLAVCMSWLVVYFFYRWLDTRYPYYLTGLGLALMLGFYTHYYFAFIWLILNTFFWLNYQALRSFAGRWLVLQFCLFMLFIPLVWMVINSPRPVFYPAVNSFLKIPGSLATMAVSWDTILILKLYPWQWTNPLNVIFLVLIICFAIAIVIGLKSVKNHRKLSLYLAYLLIPVGFISLSSFIFKPAFGLRSFIIFSPVFYILTAHGLHHLTQNRKIIWMAVFVLVIGSFLITMRHAFNQSKHNDDPYVLVKSLAGKNDVFLHADPLTYLLGRYFIPDQNHYAIVRSWYPEPIERAIGYQLIQPNELMKPAQRIWYFSSALQYYNKEAAEAKQKELESTFPVLKRYRLGLDLTVTLFDLTTKLTP